MNLTPAPRAAFLAMAAFALAAIPTAGHSGDIGKQFCTTSGCEHFGLTTTGNATRTIYRWLVADPANPGQLKAPAEQEGTPAPIWYSQPQTIPTLSSKPARRHPTR